ncbi:sugar phosphate nucleotidyltransferase [Bradyrhizobium sp. 159]|uniref:sugar phosphate nucleotidyltransferase n=1 Tax=Bradyrhizobium sp. 159 TaxID=2782632 RepID=UPI0031FEB2D4
MRRVQNVYSSFNQRGGWSDTFAASPNGGVHDPLRSEIRDKNADEMALNAPKRALILAAGVGAGLWPLTDLNPKPLVQIHGTPVLYNALLNRRPIGPNGGRLHRNLFCEDGSGGAGRHFSEALVSASAAALGPNLVSQVADLIPAPQLGNSRHRLHFTIPLGRHGCVLWLDALTRDIEERSLHKNQKSQLLRRSSR